MGLPRWVVAVGASSVLVWLARAEAAVHKAKVLSASRPDELKAALWGGDCYVVACTDVGDGGTGKTLVESAASLLAKDDMCNAATLKCQASLPSGKTILQRLSLKQQAHTYQKDDTWVIV